MTPLIVNWPTILTAGRWVGRGLASGPAGAVRKRFGRSFVDGCCVLVRIRKGVDDVEGAQDEHSLSPGELHGRGLCGWSRGDVRGEVWKRRSTSSLIALLLKLLGIVSLSAGKCYYIWSAIKC